MTCDMNIELWLPRLVVSVLLGGAVGFERQFRGRPAGLRTHILVSLGATLITLAGICLAGAASDGQVKTDPARVAAGVITGIGFLGGGAIIRTRSFVRGLTTAACIWFTAGLGVIIGFGFFLMAFAVTLLELLTLIGLSYVEEFIRPFHYRDLSIMASGDNVERLESVCRGILSEFHIKITDIECELLPAARQLKLVFHLQLRQSGVHEALLRRLESVPEISQLSWRLTVQQA